MLPVPGGDIPWQPTNSGLRRLYAVLFGLVCTQQMDQTCSRTVKYFITYHFYINMLCAGCGSHQCWTKASDTLESFFSKVAFEGDFRKKTCTCVMKTFAIFLLLKETFTIRTCSVLESFFRKLLSKENFLVCHYLKSNTGEQNLQYFTISVHFVNSVHNSQFCAKFCTCRIAEFWHPYLQQCSTSTASS